VVCLWPVRTFQLHATGRSISKNRCLALARNKIAIILRIFRGMHLSKSRGVCLRVQEIYATSALISDRLLNGSNFSRLEAGQISVYHGFGMALALAWGWESPSQASKPWLRPADKTVSKLLIRHSKIVPIMQGKCSKLNRHTSHIIRTRNGRIREPSAILRTVGNSHFDFSVIGDIFSLVVEIKGILHVWWVYLSLI
jgi:hypothetical protein